MSAPLRSWRPEGQCLGVSSQSSPGSISILCSSTRPQNALSSERERLPRHTSFVGFQSTTTSQFHPCSLHRTLTCESHLGSAEGVPPTKQSMLRYLRVFAPLHIIECKVRGGIRTTSPGLMSNSSLSFPIVRTPFPSIMKKTCSVRISVQLRENESDTPSRLIIHFVPSQLFLEVEKLRGTIDKQVFHARNLSEVLHVFRGERFAEAGVMRTSRVYP